MASSSKFFSTCYGNPFTQKQNSIVPVKSNLMEFKPNCIPQPHTWSIAHHTLPSSPSKHLHNYLIQDPSKTGVFSIYQHRAQKVETLKHVLCKVAEADPLQGLVMIDAIQRFGLDYHFQEEIESIMQRHFNYMICTPHGYINNDHDLYEISLRFRLLRQEGYHVSAGVFEELKDTEGKFKKKLSSDIKGLMSLYEASQLSINGEDTLSEAGEYSYQTLNSWLKKLDSNQARIAGNTLHHPYHKSFAKFMAKNFFNDLRGSNGWINVLKDLAKYEFKMVQSQHQQEIAEISKWWKDLGLSKELKRARNQPLKWYIWSVASFTDLSLSEQRIEITKPISFIYLIDDIFDVYGTIGELILFTEVVNRWDIAGSENLPDYMKICFKALNNITNEISCKVYKKHKWNPITSLRKAWARLCNAFLVEAKWFASRQLPSAEEYLENGIVSSGVHVVLVHVYFLLGQGITKEHVELIDDNPAIISATASILRLWDDLGSAKDDDQDGSDGSFVECYVKEHEESSVEDGREHVKHMISEAWKTLNEECLNSNPFSKTFKKASLNIARMVPLMYNYDDNHRLPSLEEHVKSLLY